MAQFPSPEWIICLMEKLNSDPGYANIARNWEGDLKFVIEPGGTVTDRIVYYVDLWHGKCRGAYQVQPEAEQPAAFTLKGSYDQFSRIMKSELDPLQAMLTRRLTVQGNMVVMMRNVPTVLDFVRCCREITDRFA